MTKLSQAATGPRPFGDAVGRLSGIRQALALADANGAGPAPDLDTRSDKVMSAAAAGLEALQAVDGDTAGRDLVEQIRAELAQISKLVLR